MVTYKDIHRAVADKIKSEFGNIVTSKNIKEKVKRPSFYIDMDNIESKDFMGVYLDRNITIRLYYFASKQSKNRIENLETMDKLNKLFVGEVIQITETTSVNITNADIDIVDNVLHFYFDLQLSEEKEIIDNTPNMDNLEYKE
ncbi:MAG: hypothetical protein FH753_00990 [Firmicutes bacterium]|nr:hypothetical protein [Bacillota bacterium]